MPPDAFTFETSGQLVMQTAIGGTGTLFGPLLGAAIWLYLSDFFQTTLHLGATWKLVLGVVFVLLVCFLRRGVIGGIEDLYAILARRRAGGAKPEAGAAAFALNGGNGQTNGEGEFEEAAVVVSMPAGYDRGPGEVSKPILQATGLTKHYGGIVANHEIDFTVKEGELLGIIGPNGAGKSTFFKMLTREVHPTAGRIVFNGRDITRFDVTRVCQLGLTKSYQVNQLFNRLTVRENITIAALAEKRGPFRLDHLKRIEHVAGLTERVDETLAQVGLGDRAELRVSELAYGEKRRLEIGLALATAPSLLLLDEPLAGLSPRERAETVQLLKSIRQGRTMVVIDHDMDAIFQLGERITVLQEGRVLVEGTPAEIKANAAVQDAYLGGIHAA